MAGRRLTDMNIFHKAVVDRKDHLLTILLETISNRVSATAFYGFCSSLIYFFSHPKLKNGGEMLGAVFAVIFLMWMVRELIAARNRRRFYEAALVRKRGVLEAFFKADEDGFEFGFMGGASQKCCWAALQSWSEGSQSFLFYFDTKGAVIKKEYFLTSDEALQLREFLKKNFPASAC